MSRVKEVFLWLLLTGGVILCGLSGIIVAPVIIILMVGLVSAWFLFRIFFSRG